MDGSIAPPTARIPSAWSYMARSQTGVWAPQLSKFKPSGDNVRSVTPHYPQSVS